MVSIQVLQQHIRRILTYKQLPLTTLYLHNFPPVQDLRQPPIQSAQILQGCG